MALPPRTLGRARTVRLERTADERYRVTVGEHPMRAPFGSEREARAAAAAEALRLDALALALVRRIRARSRRKQR
jgi:hypothetical protein